MWPEKEVVSVKTILRTFNVRVIQVYWLKFYAEKKISSMFVPYKFICRLGKIENIRSRMFLRHEYILGLVEKKEKKKKKNFKRRRSSRARAFASLGYTPRASLPHRGSCLADKTNPRARGSLNRSQRGNCSAEYNTPPGT